jgi:small conductance mechanosensitive channel
MLRLLRRWYKYFFLGVITLFLLLAWVQPSAAQLSLPPSSVNSLPKDVKRMGALETTSISFEGNELFKIASATVADRNNPGTQLPVEARAQQIEDNLHLIVATEGDEIVVGGNTPTLYDPATLKVSVAILDKKTVLVATDKNRTQAQVLLTVTDQDASLNGIQREELARRWRDILQTSLQTALNDRLPAAIGKKFQRFLWLVLAGLGITLLLLWVRRWLSYQRKKLQAAQTAPNLSMQSSLDGEGLTLPEDDDSRLEFLNLVKLEFGLSHRISIIDFVSWSLLWSQILLWLWIWGQGLNVLPITQGLGRLLLSLPFALSVLLFLLGFLNRFGNIALNRFGKIWETDNLINFENVQRRSLRISTIVNAIKGLKTFLLYLAGVIWALGRLGFDTSSVIALGAVVAFAVSLAFQNLIKDLLNGFLILLEDQYALGDVVTIGTASGVVENLNLRITQLRNSEGRLITIPNSLISQVENQTRSWARVDLLIDVDYNTNVQVALATIRDVAQKMYHDPQWQSLILEPPEVLGIENLAQTGMQIRLWLKTQPHARAQVGRELRLRVRQAMEAEQHVLAG